MNIAALEKKVRFWTRAMKVCLIVTATVVTLLIPLAILFSIAVGDFLPLGLAIGATLLLSMCSVLCCADFAAENAIRLAVAVTGVEIIGARVSRVYPKTPSDNAGFLVGDVILKINAKDTDFSHPGGVDLGLDLYEELKTNLHTIVMVSRNCKLEALTLVKP